MKKVTEKMLKKLNACAGSAGSAESAWLAAWSAESAAGSAESAAGSAAEIKILKQGIRILLKLGDE